MNIHLLIKASAIALSVAAVNPAQAATFLFNAGQSAPGAGYTVINQFDTLAGITSTNALIQSATNSSGAAPEFALFGSTSYLSVLAGGTATINFAATNSVRFDWGSVDTYNTLTVLLSGGNSLVITPGGNFSNDANGNQIQPSTNGLFTINAGMNESIVGLKLQSSSNSFEIDNLSVAAVPEPATWAMMFGGLGLVGGLMRRRSAAVRMTYA